MYAEVKETIMNTETKQEFIPEMLEKILGNENFGFEIYIFMKESSEKMKRFTIYEEKNSLKDKIENRIANAIREKFLSDSVEYRMVEDIANVQNILYIIKQNEEYNPFSFLKIEEDKIKTFSASEIENVTGIFFRFKKSGVGKVWAYQHIYPMNIPNKRKKTIFCRQVDSQFVEMKDILFPFTQKVDFIILEDSIITDEITLLQRHFNFEIFIRNSAAEVIEEIKKIGIVENMNRMESYINRSQNRYARKMMRIRNYHVIEQKSDDLLAKIKTSKRWKDVFQVQNNKIYLRNFSDVENLIDLFDERFTNSPITGDEFDTDLKKLAEPIK